MVIEGAILARVSEESDRRAKSRRSRGSSRSKSVSEQLDEGRRAANRLGWRVPETREYTDDGLSASSFATRERAGWLELRRMIEAGFVNGVIVWAVNRASREMEDWSGFLNLCRRRGVKIYVIVHERLYDSANPHDLKSLLDEGIDGWYESEKRSIDVKRGVDGAKAEGRPLSGLATGYRKVRAGNGDLENLEIEPEGAAKIRQVFSLLDTGQSVARVSAETGLSRQQVLLSARRLTYIAKRRLSDGTMIDCIWPPMVEEDQFWRVQDILAAHHGAGKRPGAYRSLLAYIAVCGVCGGSVTTQRRPPRKSATEKELFYRCHVRGCFVIPVERADDAVMFEILGELVQPGVLERYLPRADSDEAASAEQEAARYRAELDEWLEAGISPRAYKKKEDEIAPKIAEAEDRARRARAQATPAALAAQQFAEALDPLTGEPAAMATSERLNKAIEVWNDLPLLTARDLVKRTLDVVIYPTKGVPFNAEHRGIELSWKPVEAG